MLKDKVLLITGGTGSFGNAMLKGIINTYNFMDSINGITTSYSLAIILLLLIVDRNFDFIDTEFLIF